MGRVRKPRRTLSSLVYICSVGLDAAEIATLITLFVHFFANTFSLLKATIVRGICYGFETNIEYHSIILISQTVVKFS